MYSTSRKRLCETHLWKTQRRTVLSITNTYSLGETLLLCQIEANWPLPYCPRQYDSWGRPGRWAGSSVSVYAWVSKLPRAQNRAWKGSTLLWRQLTFLIFLLFIYVYKLYNNKWFLKVIKNFIKCGDNLKKPALAGKPCMHNVQYKLMEN